MNAALDEARFGPTRTLDLHVAHPTAEQAVARTEAWLRERQVARAGEVLVITGRGRGSVDGVPVVREAVLRLLYRLRRRGVVREMREHTSGSFVVQLAPVGALRDAPRRRGESRPRLAAPAELRSLRPETLALLRELAERALETLGVHGAGRLAEHVEVQMVEREMVAQFSAIAGTLAAVTPEPAAAQREMLLDRALRTALDEMADG